MNWAALAMRILSAVPMVVAGIESLHGHAKAGADKKALAMEALGLAGATAPLVDPGDKALIDATTALASQSIDGVVSLMNAAKPSTTITVPQLRSAPFPTRSSRVGVRIVIG